MSGLVSSASSMHQRSKTEEHDSLVVERMHPSLQALLREDPGLACLTSQLGRVNAKIRYHEHFKKRVVEAEEQCRQEVDELEKSLESSSSSQTQPKSTTLNDWVKHW